MYRLFGSICIMTGCVAFGFCKSFELQNHAKELECLKQIFILIKNELQYARSSLEEIFFHISSKTDGIYRLWLQKMARDLQEKNKGTFCGIWIQAVSEIEKELHLTRQEIEQLQQIGNHMSDTDSLEMYLGQLDLSIEHARNEATEKKKMYRSMGILGGVFLVIILL